MTFSTSTVALALCAALLTLAGCDRPTVIVPPPATVAVPGPAGPAGPAGNTGKSGTDTTVIVVQPAASAPAS